MRTCVTYLVGIQIFILQKPLRKYYIETSLYKKIIFIFVWKFYLSYITKCEVIVYI